MNPSILLTRRANMVQRAIHSITFFNSTKLFHQHYHSAQYILPPPQPTTDKNVQKKPYYNNHKELAKLRRGDRVDSPLRALSCAGSPPLVNKLHTPDSEEKKTILFLKPLWPLVSLVLLKGPS